MSTQVIQIDSARVDIDAIHRAGDVLRDGGLVGFPTETVYGLGARADDAAAVARLREVKGREVRKGFTVHIASRDDVKSFAPRMTGLARRFVRKGWPGPLTLIVSVEDPASVPIMAGRDGGAAEAMYFENTIGLRCPDDPVAHELLRAVGAPVVATSANPAGKPPPMTGDDVLKELDGRIDVLVDSGVTKYAKQSTIVRVTGSTYDVIREGVYDAGIIERLSAVRLLFVCTGNTCRSPMAAALAKHVIAEKLGCTAAELPSRRVLIESAGTAGGGGGASPNAVTVMARRGIDLSGHSSTRLSAESVREADHIFVMTRAHGDRIVEMVHSAQSRVALLLDDDDVADPIGGSEKDYERCARTVERGLRARLQEVML